MNTQRNTGLLLVEDEHTPDWRHFAACREEDPELFFPVGNTGPALLQTMEAQAVCQRCPVTDACLDWALTKPENEGVWGGLDETERRAMKRRGTRRRTTTAA
ncbi:WhiB family transcriptional regulator [Embleya sp. NPDC005971]|uniref:WhiB family transcriptional regulator n=1 Tax=Embleya sp. NPDC005971 TaxID=3156724 RepID=UPI0033EA932D